MSLDNIKILQDKKVKEAIKLIDKSPKQILLVIDKKNCLVGTITDGDIRRGILKGFSLEECVDNIMNKNPIVGNINETKEELLYKFKENNIHQIPLVDSNNNIIGIEYVDDFSNIENKETTIVIMAGGLGRRLRPLTEKTPKSLLRIHNIPIVQIIIERFRGYGFNNFIISVNYKAKMIESYLKDGRNLGVNISYIKEKKKLGTAGALSLLKNKVTKDFFIINGDVLTNINFNSLIKYHQEEVADATMCTKEYDFEVPYGIIQHKENNILNIEEKPIYSFFINAGVYILSSSILKYIPNNEFYNMTDLFRILIKKKRKVISFPIRECWVDIGSKKDYEKVNQ